MVEYFEGERQQPPVLYTQLDPFLKQWLIKLIKLKFYSFKSFTVLFCEMNLVGPLTDFAKVKMRKTNLPFAVQRLLINRSNTPLLTAS